MGEIPGYRELHCKWMAAGMTCKSIAKSWQAVSKSRKDKWKVKVDKG